MPKLSRDEYLEKIKARLGENPSDEDISFLEDMTDTYDSMSEGFTQSDIDEAVKAKDDEWRKKYTERFFESTAETKITDESEGTLMETDIGETITIEDLYTEKEG